VDLVNRRVVASLRILAAIGTVAAAMALTGCGLKGPLDLPPGPTPPPQAQVDAPAAVPPEPEAPPPPTRKRIFLDWLLD